MQPFKDFGMTTLTPTGTGGTDHTKLQSVGLPGFQFIQDDTSPTPGRTIPTWTFTNGSRRKA